MAIRILPGNIANMIAAGEVVQRPSSAVKELVENAIDARSSQISVIISDAGRTLIQVIDNGCGMSPDEAVLCFERHATSKIATAEDLDAITTFGFSGEALASIAAVAEVTLRTRRENDEIGTEVEIAASEVKSKQEVSCPQGSNISICNLFYNIPARRKFLKSDNVEFKHIVEEFIRIALTRPDIGFSLVHNGKDYMSLKPAMSLKFRIADLLGQNMVDELVDVATETSLVKISGYVGRPDLARKTPGNQFFFVNGRYFRSPYLHKAVMKAYENLIPDGVTPSYILFISIDPHSVDVNVSPTKTEVKFEDESVMFQIIQAAVKEVLGTNSFGDEFDFGAVASEIPSIGREYDAFSADQLAPQVSFDPSFDPFADMAGDTSSAYEPSFPDVYTGTPAQSFGQTFNPAKYVDKTDNYAALFEDSSLPSSPILIIRNSYIMTPSSSGIMMVNIKRARERILYEKFIHAISSNEPVSVAPLFPVQVIVGPANKLVFEEHSELLSQLGFDITAFGTDTVVVNGLPYGFSMDQKKVEALLADMLSALEENASSAGKLLESALAARFASAGAVHAQPISRQEAQSLIESLLKCDRPDITPSGLKTMSILTMDDIDKKFS